jgi:hypothetical protein
MNAVWKCTHAPRIGYEPGLTLRSTRSAPAGSFVFLEFCDWRGRVGFRVRLAYQELLLLTPCDMRIMYA